MPIIKSAKKRVRIAERAATRNSKTKRSLKAALKSFVTSVKGENLSKAQSELDKAVKKGIITKNKAARKKKQLSAQAKAAGVKITKTAKAAAKPAAKKVPAKKIVAKKAVAKKPATKKTTTKKTSK